MILGGHTSVFVSFPRRLTAWLHFPWPSPATDHGSFRSPKSLEETLAAGRVMLVAKLVEERPVGAECMIIVRRPVTPQPPLASPIVPAFEAIPQGGPELIRPDGLGHPFHLDSDPLQHLAR